MHPKVRELDSLLRRLERPGSTPERPRVSTGCAPLDAALPGQGFWRGSLVEWLGDGPGCGAGMLALRAAREACRAGGALVVIDPGHHFYPPAAAAGGVDLQKTIVVRAAQIQQDRSNKQSLWALDQALRCPHVGAVVAWPQQLDSRVFRRLQLAVETSGCLGLLIRSAAAQREASWADVRLLVSPVGQARPQGATAETRGPTAATSGAMAASSGATAATSGATAGPLGSSPLGANHQAEELTWNWRFRIALLRCRGGAAQRTVDLEIDERTGDLHASHPGNLATQLADSAVDSRQARA